MTKLLSDTRLVAAFAAVVVICATILVALNKVAFADAVKTVGGFLGGLLLAWQRGTALTEAEAAAVAAAEKLAADKKVEEKEKKTSIPPILPLLTLCLAFSFLPGASCASAKPIIRNVNDIAADWCVAHYSSMKGLSAEDALRTFCTGEKVLKPWLDLILMGQKNGVGKMGMSGDKCEVTVTKESVSVDAGKD